MINKYYTAEVVSRSCAIVGSRTVRVMAWQSPILAHEKMLDNVPDGYTVINLRLIK